MFDRLRTALGRRAEKSRPDDTSSTEPTDPAEPKKDTTPPRPVRVDRAAASLARWSFRALAVAAALFIVGWLIQQTWSLLLPLALALLLAAILWAPMQFLRRLMPGGLAALIVLVGFLAALIGLIGVLVPRVAAEGGELLDRLYAAVDDLRVFISGPPLNLGDEQFTNMLNQGLEQLQQNQQSIATGLLTGVSSLGSFLVNFVLVLFLVFFILKDGPRFLPWSHRWLPQRSQRHVDALGGRVWQTLTGFIWSQAAVAFVDAVLIGAGLWILDVPFALPISVAIFFASFIPIVGAIATGILATFVALIDQGIWIALAVLAIVLVVQQVEGNLLQPFLVGRTLALHPAVVLGAVTVGGTVFGIVGAFLAVPVAGTVITALRYGREQATRPPVPPIEEPAPASKPAPASSEPGDAGPAGTGAAPVKK